MDQLCSYYNISTRIKFASSRNNFAVSQKKKQTAEFLPSSALSFIKIRSPALRGT